MFIVYGYQGPLGCLPELWGSWAWEDRFLECIYSSDLSPDGFLPNESVWIVPGTFTLE